MRVGVVDIGTNSMRLLITDGIEEVGRWIEVTGLGRGLEETGSLSKRAMRPTLDALEAFGRRMDHAGVQRRLAIATSASRDASNREEFFDRAESALGVRPTLITGSEEGRYAFNGALSGLDPRPPVVVSDIGGGSTEFVTAGHAISVDIGTVRLGDRVLPERPPSASQVEIAEEMVESAFSDVPLGDFTTHVGVAGTWTSLSAIALDLPPYDRQPVHGSVLSVDGLDSLIQRLSVLTIDETKAIPGLDPRRAPVILPGALIARAVMRHLGSSQTVVSEKDTLDGAALQLLGIR